VHCRICFGSKAMTTPKRIAFKDIAAAPLNWKAPSSTAQETDHTDNKDTQEEHDSKK
jgi:hypothetical protein